MTIEHKIKTSGKQRTEGPSNSCLNGSILKMEKMTLLKGDL